MGHKKKPPEEMSRKNARAKARRHGREVDKVMKALYKPVTEWDDEELARGRPRAKNGTFVGAAPGWVTRRILEEAERRHKEMLKGSLNATTPAAIAVIHMILTNDDMVMDEDGNPIRPMVPASTKLDAAKFLIEMSLGKPKQTVGGDITLKLERLLAPAMINPSSEDEDDIVELEAIEDEEDEDDD